MPRRICAALANPHVHVLGEREAYDLDLDQVLRAGRRHGKAVEVNGYPDRLDLCDVHAGRAPDLGVLLAVGTDTHMLDEEAFLARVR